VATVFDVGDVIATVLTVNPFDGTTAATVAVTKPDGSPQTLLTGPTSSGGGQTWTATWAADHADGGDYSAVWTVTGVGRGTQAKVYPVRPLPMASDWRPAWSPFLSEVGDHIPTRTLDQSQPGVELFLGTFTGLTTPTDEQAQRHLDSAVSSVLGAAGTLVDDDGVLELARLVASLRAAAAIERAYPLSDRSLETAAALDARADAELKHLAAANSAAGAGSSAVVAFPSWQSPAAVSWGDDLLADFPGWGRLK
jgi:hypothetical protein